jgi:MFS transporter, DHA2 family, glioxin efflux transporter
MLQVDPVGVILVMGGIVAFVQALHLGGSEEPWSSGTVIGLLVGSVAIGVSFVAWEWHQGERAAIPPRLMADRNILVNSLYTALFAGSYFTVIYYLPIYFQSIDDVSAIISGVRNLPMIISVSVTMLLSSAYVSKIGPKPLLLAGAYLATIGCALLYTLRIGSSAANWIGYQFVAGIGWGLSFQLPIIIVQAKVAPTDIGPATAIILCKFLARFSLDRGIR